MLVNYLAVAVGGSLGALLRYQVSILSVQHWHGAFPIATLIVNVLGSLGFGMLFYLLVEKSMLSEYWRLVWLVGFMGALTTFSTFSHESLQLILRGQILLALVSTLANVLLSLAAVSAGYFLVKLTVD